MRKELIAFKKCCCTAPHGAYITYFFINSAMNSRKMKFTLLKLLQMYKNVWYQLALSRCFNSKDQTLKSIQQVN